MENLKFILVSLIVLIIVSLLGYWAFVSLQSGGEHASAEKIDKLESENEKLTKEVTELKKELALLTPKEEEKPVEPKVEPKTETPTASAPTKTTYKQQTLINELQKLIDDKVYMKQGSQGTRVGTVQKFLNLYNKTNNKVDNDYGASTKKAVAAFQKAVGLTADGEAGPSTFQKMIDWLKK
jgi:murein L,D-transpeptidase YcbB/YkuD